MVCKHSAFVYLSFERWQCVRYCALALDSQNYHSVLKKSVVQWGRQSYKQDWKQKSRVSHVSNRLFVALQATLFVRHPETGKLLVNFDPKILEVVRETKCMIKMQLDVPEQAKRLLKLESKLKGDKLYLQVRWILFSFLFKKYLFVWILVGS